MTFRKSRYVRSSACVCVGGGTDRIDAHAYTVTAVPPSSRSPFQELAVPDKARAVAWCGDRLCVGFTKEYNLISINSGIMTDIFPNKGVRPIATKLPNNELLLCRDSACCLGGGGACTTVRSVHEKGHADRTVAACATLAVSRNERNRREHHRRLRRQADATLWRDVDRAAGIAQYAPWAWRLARRAPCHGGAPDDDAHRALRPSDL